MDEKQTRAIVYDELRTAHIERIIRSVRRADVFYQTESYDYDSKMAREIRPRKVNLPKVFWEISRGDYSLVEINEPAYLRALPLLLTVILSGYIKRLWSSRRPIYVTYAIENIDIAAKIASHLRISVRLVNIFIRPVLRFVFSRIDRVAFGTVASKDAYEKLLGSMPVRVEQAIFPALEPVCSSCTCEKQPFSVLFLGVFDERKGVETVLAAWPRVAASVPNGQLTILGKGPLERLVSSWASQRGDVTVHLDPSRESIHAALARSRVLVLPSISTVRWREQVGLPILEGLSHGCIIVTSIETGLSDWLESRGHILVQYPGDPSALATCIEEALAKRMPPEEILGTLPPLSGRQQAEEWLCRPI